MIAWTRAALVVALINSAQVSAADSYPAKVVRIITAGAGGGSDFATRLIATPLGAALGQQIIVDNRGVPFSRNPAKAPADGYTLLLSGPSLWLLPFMRENVASDMRDFTPITMATQTANILVVHPTLPADSVKALIGLAKSKPGQLNVAASGNGNSVHIAGELFKAMAGCDIVTVKYKGATQALTDLISGQTHSCSGSPARCSRT